MHFAQADALKACLNVCVYLVLIPCYIQQGSLVTTLKEVQPTVLFGVPRTWEKIQAAMQSLSPGMPHHCLREEVGLGRLKLAITGAAPIHPSVLEYFSSVGVPLLELFGMSELTGPAIFNQIGRWKLGSIGQPMKGSKVKISRLDNSEGEVCLLFCFLCNSFDKLLIQLTIYGRHVFMGYLNNEAKTKEAIDDEGWLHSGDIGRFDEDGYLFITGRIKGE